MIGVKLQSNCELSQKTILLIKKWIEMRNDSFNISASIQVSVQFTFWLMNQFSSWLTNQLVKWIMSRTEHWFTYMIHVLICELVYMHHWSDSLLNVQIDLWISTQVWLMVWPTGQLWVKLKIDSWVSLGHEPWISYWFSDSSQVSSCELIWVELRVYRRVKSRIVSWQWFRLLDKSLFDISQEWDSVRLQVKLWVIGWAISQALI